MSDVISDIKSRIDIVDVVSQYVQLKKTGHNYKGLCPFHSEKTPSFVVSADKQIAHCFGCNKGGDIFSFLEEVEGVTFAEALEILADRAGIKMEKVKKAVSKESKGEKEDLFKAHDLACDFFEKQLYETNNGKKVLEYLYKRGLTDETIKEFRIGFAPDDYKVLHTYLLTKGISKNVLIKGGFVSAKNLADDRVYDKYRARLMFPIFDYFGRICGFGGRALKKDQMPKYLNSPENAIYSKSKVLYGLSHAKNSIKEVNQVVLVEGYFDVILPYQAGVKNVVATSGTALTVEQVRMIKRLTSDVVSCFDSDVAGFGATKRAFELLQAEQMVMKTIILDKKDPAEVVVDQGGEAFKEALVEAKEFMEFFLERSVSERDVKTIDGRREVLSDLLPYYKILSPASKDFYIRELSVRLNVPERFLYDEIALFKLPNTHPARVGGMDQGDRFKMSFENVLLSIVLEFPSRFKEVAEVLDENHFEGDAKAIYKELANQYNSSRVARDEWNFDSEFPADLKAKVDILRIYAEEKYLDFSVSVMEGELEKLIDRMSRDRKTRRLVEIQKQIDVAEKANDKEKLKELLQEHQQLLSQ